MSLCPLVREVLVAASHDAGQSAAPTLWRSQVLLQLLADHVVPPAGSTSPLLAVLVGILAVVPQPAALTGKGEEADVAEVEVLAALEVLHMGGKTTDDTHTASPAPLPVLPDLEVTQPLPQRQLTSVDGPARDWGGSLFVILLASDSSLFKPGCFFILVSGGLLPDRLEESAKGSLEGGLCGQGVADCALWGEPLHQVQR